MLLSTRSWRNSAAVVMLGLSCAMPAAAQDNQGAGGSSNTTRTTETRTDRDTDLGWLGLLGLAGLLGLRGRHNTDTNYNSRTTASGAR
jgi:MYXO-CTERM domain-containing protein